MSKSDERMKLRRLLWLRHGCDPAGLYGDDGEMQCGVCILDFKRDSVETIEKKFSTDGEKAIQKYMKEHPEFIKEPK